jgi:hypothetical protein
VKRNIDKQQRPESTTSLPVKQRSPMVRKKGIWVHLGKTPQGFDWDSALDTFRDERIKEVVSMGQRNTKPKSTGRASLAKIRARELIQT